MEQSRNYRKKVKILLALFIFSIIIFEENYNFQKSPYIFDEKGYTAANDFTGEDVTIILQETLSSLKYKIRNDSDKWLFYGDTYIICKWTGLFWKKVDANSQSNLILYSLKPHSVSGFFQIPRDELASTPGQHLILLVKVRTNMDSPLQEGYLKTHFSLTTI